MASESMLGETNSAALRQADTLRLQQANGAGKKQSAGGVDPTESERASRREALTPRPKIGSDAIKRAGLDPSYHTGPEGPTGVISSEQNRTSLTPQADWTSFFNTPTAAPARAPAAVSPIAAPPPGSLEPSSGASLGTIAAPLPASRSGLWPAPKVDWTGPSLLPHVGPGSPAPFQPGQQGTNFTVPTPLTGPMGTRADDAANLAANAAMAAPGGATGFWNHSASSSPTEFAPDPRVASLTDSGHSGMTPYGSISAQTPGYAAAHPAPFAAPDWAGLRDTSPANPAQSAAVSSNPAASLADPRFTAPNTAAQKPPVITNGKKSAAVDEGEETAGKTASAAPQMDAYS